jgi:hypothetical protein
LLNKTNFLSLFLFLMSLFISCNRKCDSGCCKNCPQYYTDQEFREYLVFPIGSYWIYQDSATSNTDSIYLFSQHFEMRDLKDIYGYDAKYLEQKFSASFNNDTILKFWEPRNTNDLEPVFIMKAILMILLIFPFSAIKM